MKIKGSLWTTRVSIGPVDPWWQKKRPRACRRDITHGCSSRGERSCRDHGVAGSIPALPVVACRSVLEQDAEPPVDPWVLHCIWGMWCNVCKTINVDMIIKWWKKWKKDDINMNTIICVVVYVISVIFLNMNMIITYWKTFLKDYFNMNATIYVVVVCLILYCLLLCYCFMFVIVLCLLWSIKGLQMQISCIATIWYGASNANIYVLIVHCMFQIKIIIHFKNIYIYIWHKIRSKWLIHRIVSFCNIFICYINIRGGHVNELILR